MRGDRARASACRPGLVRRSTSPRDPTVLFRIFHYPALPDNADADEWGVGEHTDYGLLTLLAPGRARRPAGPHAGGRWIEVPAEPDVLVCNIGDMLDRLTRGPLPLHPAPGAQHQRARTACRSRSSSTPRGTPR